MSLEKIKIIYSSLRFKIIFWYILFSTLSLTLLFMLSFYTYSQSLINQDRTFILNKIETLKDIVKKNSIQNVADLIDSENKLKVFPDYFIRLEMGSKVSFFPERFSGYYERHQVETFLSRNKFEKNGWIYLKTQSIENDIEMYSLVFKDGTKLLVGKKVDDRDDLLESFKEIYLYVLIVSILFGFFVGYLFSIKVVSPINNLNQLIDKIKNGEMDNRIPIQKSSNEIGLLTIKFNEMLNQIENSKKSMRETLDILSHELRTPLTRFKIKAELSLNEKEDLSIIKETVQDLIEGINEILIEFRQIAEITEMENGVNDLNFELVDVDKLIYEVIDLYEIIADQKNIKINYYSCQIQFVFDKKRMKQVIANLLDNSLKYSPVKSEINISAFLLKNYLMLVVEDFGLGIKANEQALIFEKMFRGSNSRKEKGLGLGLSLVNTIVHAHLGKIELESTENVGTKIKIFIPSNLMQS